VCGLRRACHFGNLMSRAQRWPETRVRIGFAGVVQCELRG